MFAGILVDAKIIGVSATGIALNCDRALQAWMPSYHVWRMFELPAAPQFPNQEPPAPQQLSLPDFLMLPHLAHTELMVVPETGGVCVC